MSIKRCFTIVISSAEYIVVLQYLAFVFAVTRQVCRVFYVYLTLTINFNFCVNSLCIGHTYYTLSP